MAEATYTRSSDKAKALASATIDVRQVLQLVTGEAAFLDATTAVSSGSYTDSLRSGGKVTVPKATGVVLLAGQDAWWDYSAGNVTYKRVNDRDFRLGIVAEDATSNAISVVVDLNKPRADLIDVKRDACLSTTTGTVAAGGFDRVRRIGGAHKLLLSSTNEAQKVDLLSVDGFDPTANWVVEAVFRVVNGGAGTAPDFNIGAANGTHASDAESITEFAGLHLDGNSVNIYAASRDGVSTAIASTTDTTIDYTAGSAVANRVHVLIDGRDPADVQIYINGALVLGSTVFDVDSAAGPLFLLAHMEKTAATDQLEIDVDELRCWISEQG